MGFVIGLILGALFMTDFSMGKGAWLSFNDWQCTASHREGPEHDQHDVCDQYSRKENL